MERWEYRYIVLHTTDLKTRDQGAAFSEDSWNTFLNREGSNGWELRHILPWASGDVGWQFVFMRKAVAE